MGSITTLGKRNHTLLRDDGTGGGWVNGEYVNATRTPVVIRANVQPSFGSPLLKILPESEREKESVLIFSNDWVYTARSGANPLQADILQYRGAEWEVQVSRPFGNFGEHCEAIAIKLKDSVIPRETGKVGVIN